MQGLCRSALSLGPTERLIFVTVAVKAEHIAGDRYRVRVFVGTDDFGRGVQKSRYFRAPSQREANKAASSHESALRAEIAAGAARPGSVGELIDAWRAIRDANDSPSTVKGRSTIVNRIRKDLGHIGLDKLTARHVDAWMATLTKEGKRPITVSNHHATLRAILRQGADWGMCSDEPTRRARPPKRNRRKIEAPTAQTVARLLDSAPPDLRIAGELAARGGLRRGEVVGLRWSDLDGSVLHVRRALVDLGDGKWHEKLPKSGQARSIDLDDGLVKLLAEHRERQHALAKVAKVKLVKDGPILADQLHDPRGATPRRAGWATLAWQRHRGKVPVRFHDLRHWHATELIDAGVPFPVVQQRMGHLLLSTTTDVYTHQVKGAGVAAAKVIGRRRVGTKPRRATKVRRRSD